MITERSVVVFHQRLAATLFLFSLCVPSANVSVDGQDARSANTDWPRYGGTLENNHYSPLAQINRENVSRLQTSWQFDSGEEGGLQTSPIIVKGVLYGITPTKKIFALDAATGKLLWKFDSGMIGTQPNRGLAFWQSSEGQDSRIL